MGGIRFETPTAEELAEKQRAFRERMGIPMEGPPPPEFANRNPVLFLWAPIRFPFAGRMYEIPPTPWPLAQEIDALWADFARVRVMPPGAEKAVEASAVIERVCLLLRKAVRPSARDPVRSVLWKLGLVRNPFRNATEEQLGELMGLLLGCRIKSSGLASAPHPTSPSKSTSPTDSPSSSNRFPNGLAPTGTP